MALDSETVQQIVEKVLDRLGESAPDINIPTPRRSGEANPLQLPESLSGALFNIDAAVEAAAKAYCEYSRLPLELRRSILSSIRAAALEGNCRWAHQAVTETGLGRADHKVEKNRLAIERTPGTEILTPTAASGDAGLMIEELAPWGVIAAILPSTNPIATIICNAISMLAAGNAVVFNPHPAAAAVSIDCIRTLNAAIISAGGPANLICTVTKPSIETAQSLMSHPGIALLVVTGGPGVVKAAFASGKKVIAAGPGNPPVVVDETADITAAARHIVKGAGFDNNVVCVDEKEIICVEAVADDLKAALGEAGAFELSRNDWRHLTRTVLARPGSPTNEGAPEKAYVGKDARLLLEAIGIEGAGDPGILFADVAPDDPFVWTEQLMPALPLVRVSDVDAAIELALAAEGGRRHTALMHSRNIEKLSSMARVVNTSIFVKNGPAIAGLGAGGVGHASFTIASPTGEGLTTARSFARRRRCTLVDYFRIV